MKKIIATTAFVILSIDCFAQDIIVKKDGSIIQAKVSEIGTSEVKYKKWSNQDGPSYAIVKSDILAITYQNGEKETFESTSIETTSNGNSPQTPKLVSKKPSVNNAILLAKYGKSHTSSIKAKNKDAGAGLGIFAFDENCIISNEDIEITLVPSTATSPEKRGGNGSKLMFGNSYLRGRYCVQVKNNTNQTVYIDLANCTRINEKTNETICFYDSEILSVTTGSSSGTAMNLGGITGALGIGGALGSLARATTVGKGSNSSVQRTFNQQQVVTVPPNSSRKITDFKLIEADKGNRFKFGEIMLAQRGEELIFGSYNILESFHNHFAQEYHSPKIKKGEIKIGETKRYSVEESPIVYNYTITYSTDPTFAVYSVITPKLYLKEVHGQKSTYIKGMLTADASEPLKALPDMDAYTIFGPIVFEK